MKVLLQRHRWHLLLGVLGVLCVGFGVRHYLLLRRYNWLTRPSALTTWPWPQARRSTPHRGVTRWLDTSSPDGTSVELIEFDFGVNPGLRLELYDGDEDDTHRLDNKVLYWSRGIGSTTRHLQARLEKQRRGQLVAAWNGAFFGLKNLKPREADWAFHLAPVVVRGKVLHNTSNHRWTFGVQYANGRPVFKAQHLPGRKELQKNYHFAAGSVQCLLRDGEPLRLQPFPWKGEKPMPAPVASTPLEAGHIPTLDHMKTSRISIGWTGHYRRLYLLFVKEPDGELPSRAAVQRWKPAYGGWTLADVQRFWLSLRDAKGVWHAVGSDGGDVAQLALRQPDSRYEMVPPRMSLESGRATRRIKVPAKAAQPLTKQPLPHELRLGGALMYFYVCDTKARTRQPAKARARKSNEPKPAAKSPTPKPRTSKT